jgi:hypothetical protein
MSVHTQKFLKKNFPILIYFFALTCMLITLYHARSYGLLPKPVPGTDQLGMLDAAVNMSHGKLPDAGYMYSYLYTAFLFVLHLLSQNNLVVMRILQACVCAMIPVFIYKLSLRLRLGTTCGQLASLLYCFYGPAILISLSFLRAGPLTLCFVVAANYLVLAFFEKKPAQYFKAGLWMSMCILGRENFLPVAVVPALMLLYPSIRKYIKKSFIFYYIGGIAALLVPVIIYNFAAFGSLSLVPGHWQNVMGAYHSGNSSAVGTATSILTNIPPQILNYLCSYEIPNSLSFYAHREVIEFMTIFTVPFNLLATMSLSMLCFRLRNKAIVFMALLVAVYVGSMLPFHMFYRFRIPTVPLLCCLCSAGIIMLVQDFNHKKYVRAISGLVLFLLLFALTMRDAYVLRPPGEIRAVVTTLIHSKRFHEAELLIGKLPPADIYTLRLKTAFLRALHMNGEKVRAMKLFKLWQKDQIKQIPPENKR